MINWSQIDCVFLDMDGTILDLHFDNYFWLTYLPKVVAERHFPHLSQPEAEIQATALLTSKYTQVQGTLRWYSTDYWSKELSLPIIELKRQLSHLIRYRSDALTFLGWLGDNSIKRILVTNAHPDNLALKHQITGIQSHMDHSYISHQLNLAKEDPLFWHTLSQHIEFDPGRALFIDDTETVLRAAEDFGIQELICIRQPDSTVQGRNNLNFKAIDLFSELYSKHDD